MADEIKNLVNKTIDVMEVGNRIYCTSGSRSMPRPSTGTSYGVVSQSVEVEGVYLVIYTASSSASSEQLIITGLDISGVTADQSGQYGDGVEFPSMPTHRGTMLAGGGYSAVGVVRMNAGDHVAVTAYSSSYYPSWTCRVGLTLIRLMGLN